MNDIGIENLPAVEEIYAHYQKDPRSVDPSWLSFFSDSSSTQQTSDNTLSPEMRISNLIHAYRLYGHLLVQANPIATHPLTFPWQLSLEELGFHSDELNRLFPTSGLLAQKEAPLQEIIDVLKSIYGDKIGVEYMGLQSPEMEKWLQEQIEPNRFKINLTIEQKKKILQQLNQSELFESFIHTRYTGQKRFSLEGGETLIPMLKALIEEGTKLGVEEHVIGMAHRGRLNVLSNILNKSHSEIFSEFEEGYIPNVLEGSGDVKYHKGFSSEVESNGCRVRIQVAPNPSHLESVDPVVEGKVRAKQILLNDGIAHKKVLPVLIHGDAALSGQGVVYETMQLYRLPGYTTGGTVHLVINNQIGFTTTPRESRSTKYCTDIAKTFDAPVFHVNAEDPEGCVYATLLAIELRQQFHCDVFIDLNCYRKYGHNESDEPAYTQPLEYQLIRKKRPIREIYRDQLIHQGVMEKSIAESLEHEFTQALNQAHQEGKLSLEKSKNSTTETQATAKSDQKAIHTAVSKEVLQSIGERCFAVPSDFHLHQKLIHLMQERQGIVLKESKPLDWGTAEILAYASLLWNGTHVRVTGQDCRRGTFSHRHAVWIDVVNGKDYSPLNALKDGQGRFEIFNSTLSEYAALGFEFGYSTVYSDALVIWEAQFGDFANGAQVIIDQYIAPSEQKWGQKSGVTLFLPHGYEGQGPEHSSGRIERFLALAGDDNMRIVNPTTPAQLFHLLRKQGLNPVRKPLIVFTPKGLLRHPACVSALADITQGTFEEIIDDPTAGELAKKLVLCSGRIYYDLIAERTKLKAEDLAIIRIEQLYPFPEKQLVEILKRYTKVKKVMWVQEEPNNMGAWGYINSLIKPLLPKGQELHYVSRERSSSTAVGSHAIHAQQHTELMSAVFKNKE